MSDFLHLQNAYPDFSALEMHSRRVGGSLRVVYSRSEETPSPQPH